MSKEEKRSPPPPALIAFGDGDSIRHVPVIDVDEVLSEHLKIYPLELPSGKGAMVFTRITQRDLELIREKHKEYLDRMKEGEMAEIQLLTQKKKENLTKEEREKLEQYDRESFPFTSEILYAMLDLPKVETLELFRKFLNGLPREDWEAIQRFTTTLLKTEGFTVKN